MRKIVAITCLIALLLSDAQKSYAIALPVAATAAATALVASGAAYYYLNNTQNYTTDSNHLKIAAYCSYFAVDLAAKTVQAVTESIIGKITWQTAADKIRELPNEFPTLYNAINPPTTMAVGTVLTINGNNYRITYVFAPTTQCQNSMPSSTIIGGTYYVYSGGATSCTTPLVSVKTQRYSIVSTTEPATAGGPLPIKDVPAAIGSLSTDTAANDEVRRLAQLIPPAPAFDYYTPGLDQLYPVPNAVPETQAAALDSAFAQQQAAADALAAAQAHESQAAAAAAADPTNADLANQATAATAATAAAAAALAAATAAADKAASDSDMPSVTPPDQLKSFDWSAARRLLGAMETAWPFNLLLSLSGLFAPLVAPPVAPSFALPIWGGNSINIDLSMFDTVATITRWAISILLTALGITAIVRWYRGA